MIWLLEKGYKGEYKITAVDNQFVSQASVKSLIKRFNKGDVVNFTIYATKATQINRTVMQAYRLSLI